MYRCCRRERAARRGRIPSLGVSPDGGGLQLYGLDNGSWSLPCLHLPELTIAEPTYGPCVLERVRPALVPWHYVVRFGTVRAP